MNSPEQISPQQEYFNRIKKRAANRRIKNCFGKTITIRKF